VLTRLKAKLLCCNEADKLHSSKFYATEWVKSCMTNLQPASLSAAGISQHCCQ